MSSNDQVRIDLTHGHAVLDTASAVLSFHGSTGKRYFEFKLSPTCEYAGRPIERAAVALTQNEGGRHFVFAGRDAASTVEAHLELRDGFIDYWVVLAPQADDDVRVRYLHYGQDGPDPGHGSAHELSEFFILCPDRYGTCIPKKGKVCFKLGAPSFNFDKDNNFPHEGGRTIISPYFGALRAGSDWLGVGTMAVPASQYGLEMAFAAGRATIDFYYGGSLKVAGPTALPRISFFTAPDKLAAGRAYIDRLYADGLARPNTQWEPEWGGPIYCFFSDQMYEYQTDRATLDLGSEMVMTENYCNDAFLERCLEFLETHAIHYKVIIIDYGWFAANGEWAANTKRFADFKTTIKKLQAQGKKVLLWYAPYFNDETSSNYREHPEIAVRQPDGTPLTAVRFGTEINYLSDFTHPAMRELCRRDLEKMLGPNGLDADGIKIDCTNRPPTVENTFHDPAWGTGELFHYKAAKFIYETAKSIKPDCCINATAGNPFFNGTFDLHRLHDGMEYNLDSYEERAWAAWFCGAGISDLDDWPSYDLFTVRANLRKIAYGAPSLYAVRKRGGPRKMRCSTGYSMTVPQEDLELLGALYEMCGRAPADLRQEIHIDPFRKVFWRKHGAGKLKGFYAAVTLNGNQAVAVYEEDVAHLVSISDIAVAIPLPPHASDVGVCAVARDGTDGAAVDFEVFDGQLVFEANRCVGDLKYYRICYTL